jgi:hypothetical protein
MVTYLGNQIITGNLKYTDVITLYPSKKAAIDQYLTEKGKANLIVTTPTTGQ